MVHHLTAHTLFWPASPTLERVAHVHLERANENAAPVEPMEIERIFEVRDSEPGLIRMHALHPSQVDHLLTTDAS